MKFGIAASLGLAVLVTGLLSGCRLEKNEILSENDSQKMVSSKPGGDMNALVEEIWDAQVVPHLSGSATNMQELVELIAGNLDNAGETKGYRTTSEGSPWNFSAKVIGEIVSAKTDTRAAVADVDINGDGLADVTLQLGPVIKGTALRDILPFIDFTSFTDQIEFAQLSRALNTKAYETALKDLPRESLVGQKIEAVGAFTMRGSGASFLITPISAKVTAP